MKTKKIHEFRASTLVEMLVVIVVSGVLFLVLFDGVDLVRRYTNRLNRGLSAGNVLLDNFQQMAFHFYRDGERFALGTVQDSLWLCSRENGQDTLFRGVEECRVIPSAGYLARVDSLGIRFRYRGKELYFLFAGENKAEEDWERRATGLENQFKEEYDDDME